MDATLDVVLTRAFNGKPLATIRNLPGPDTDLTPAQMRRLAAALNAVAMDCEAQPMGKRFVKKSRRYGGG